MRSSSKISSQLQSFQPIRSMGPNSKHSPVGFRLYISTASITVHCYFLFQTTMGYILQRRFLLVHYTTSTQEGIFSRRKKKKDKRRTPFENGLWWHRIFLVVRLPCELYQRIGIGTKYDIRLVMKYGHSSFPWHYFFTLFRNCGGYTGHHKRDMFLVLPHCGQLKWRETR